ncbi:MAG: hypothetical protein K2M44_07170 [Clostridia bacterium]|nr:hypothetical protein [Clostridia bacterium]
MRSNKYGTSTVSHKILAIALIALLCVSAVCALCSCEVGLSYYDSGVKLKFVEYDGSIPFGGATLIRSRQQLVDLFTGNTYILTEDIEGEFSRFDDSFFERNSLIFVFAALSEDASLSVDRVVRKGKELKITLGYHGVTDGVKISKYVSSLFIVNADKVRDVSSDVIECETSKR